MRDETANSNLAAMLLRKENVILFLFILCAEILPSFKILR
jgi:hypothetical protein